MSPIAFIPTLLLTSSFLIRSLLVIPSTFLRYVISINYFLDLTPFTTVGKDFPNAWIIFSAFLILLEIFAFILPFALGTLPSTSMCVLISL